MDTRIPEVKEFILDPAAAGANLRFLDTAKTIELSSDFTLPDYLPEIKKMLRTELSLSPLSRYIGAGNVEFSGRADYDLLYSAPDGSLASARFGEDMGFDVDLALPATLCESEGTEILASTVCEGLFCRVVAPRRVNIKCRLRSSVCGFGRDDHEPRFDIGEHDPKDAERLTVTAKCARLRRLVCDPIELEDEIAYDGSMPICATGRVRITDISNGVCRGEAEITLLFADSAARKSLPFTQPIDMREGETLAIVRGICGEIKLEDTGMGDRLLVGAEITLEAELASEEDTELVRDAFLPGCASEVDIRELTTESIAGIGRGSLHLDGRIPLGEAQTAQGDAEMSIIDIKMTTGAVSVGVSEGHCVLSGNAALHILARSGDEYTHIETEIPFELDTEISMPSDADPRCSALPMPMSLGCGVTGGEITYSAELDIMYCVMLPSGHRTVERLTVLDRDADAEKRGGITVYYPDKGETLWDVAKRFGARLSDIAELNSLDSAEPSGDISDLGNLIICR